MIQKQTPVPVPPQRTRTQGTFTLVSRISKPPSYSLYTVYALAPLSLSVTTMVGSEKIPVFRCAVNLAWYMVARPQRIRALPSSPALAALAAAGAAAATRPIGSAPD